MTKTEKAALQESLVQVGAALVINFPLQTFMLWLMIERVGMDKCLSYIFNYYFYIYSSSIDKNIYDSYGN